jgi:hypothetical protein
MDIACNLNELLDELDTDNRTVAFMLFDTINELVAKYGELPNNRDKWIDHHYLVYLLHCTMMAVLNQETAELAVSIAHGRGDQVR